jgi:hypothetical protein
VLFEHYRRYPRSTHGARSGLYRSGTSSFCTFSTYSLTFMFIELETGHSWWVPVPKNLNILPKQLQTCWSMTSGRSCMPLWQRRIPCVVSFLDLRSLIRPQSFLSALRALRHPESATDFPRVQIPLQRSIVNTWSSGSASTMVYWSNDYDTATEAGPKPESATDIGRTSEFTRQI